MLHQVLVVASLVVGIQISLVVDLGPSCSTLCGILVPQAGIKPVSPAVEGRFLTTGPPGSPCCILP